MKVDFELRSYGDLLRTGIEAGYKFVSFDEIGKETSPRSCLLRHDIDSELLGCGGMLEVEKSLGVTATYFLMTRSTAYNLFSVEATAMVARILSEVTGLACISWASAAREKAFPSVVEEVLREARWLEQEFGVKAEAVSFHQPTSSDPRCADRDPRPGQYL